MNPAIFWQAILNDRPSHHAFWRIEPVLTCFEAFPLIVVHLLNPCELLLKFAHLLVGAVLEIDEALAGILRALQKFIELELNRGCLYSGCAG